MFTTKTAIRAQVRTSRTAQLPHLSRTALQRNLLRQWTAALQDLGITDSPTLTPALFIPAPTEPDISLIRAHYPTALLPAMVDASGRRLDTPAWTLAAATQPFVSPHAVALAPGDEADPHLIQKADVIAVPAVAVDETGTRLGQGGGWYDRTLPYANAPVISIVFPDEVFPRDVLHRELHDYPVNAVITPAWHRTFRLG